MSKFHESGRPLGQSPSEGYSSPLDLLESYRFHLPPELIAQTASEKRDESRLLVLERATGRISHRRFRDLPEFFGPEDLLVANNTAVIRARLLGHRLLPVTPQAPEGIGGKIEMLLLEKRGDRIWEGAFHSSARQAAGLKFRIPCRDGSFVVGELLSGARDSAAGTVVARFDRDPLESGAGELPLPHYIEREKPSDEDESRYQTVYAKEPGSAAAPTAGLHFTPQILATLRERGTAWEEVTLNVGLGTFRPVKVARIRDHVMHEERYFVPESTAAAVNRAKREGRRVTAVGTTSVRTLESAAVTAAAVTDPASGARSARHAEPEIAPGESRTSIFIHPGYEFKVVDRLITNFHLPESTLLMLVSAFAGYENTMRAYEEAVRERYRFFSYGDAMLIL